MDTADGADLAKVQARRAKHRARGINGNGFGESLSEKAQTATEEWLAPNVPNGGRMVAHATSNGRTAIHNGKKVELDLNHQGQEWRAPQAGDSNRGPKSQRGASYGYRDQAGMHSLVSQANQWLAPLVADGGEKIMLASHQGSLLKQAHDFRPPSSPDHPIIAGGSTSSTAGPNSNQPSAKRKLNPIFVEALMRWPTGLSGFARQETAWTRWWLLMPGFVSTLFSAIPPTPRGLFDD